MTTSTSSRPLLVSGDPALLDEMLRIVTTAGQEAQVAADAGGARAGWSGAGVVLVGGDCAASVGSLVRGGALPRRPAVVVVTADLDDAAVWQRAVSVGAEHVVCLPDAEGWLVDRVRAGVGGAGQIVAVVGGCGGAGATVLATAVAMAGLRAGRQTMLVDADPLGGGIDLLLGLEHDRGARWSSLVAAEGRVGPTALREALPALGALTVLAWDRDEEPAPSPAALHVLVDVARSGEDLVVVDLPRQVDDGAAAVLDAAACTLLVVPADLRAVAAASRVAVRLRPVCRRLEVVVRRGSSRLPAADVGRALGLPLAGELRAEPGLRECLERGEPPGRGPGPLARLADGVLADLGAARTRLAG